MSETRPRPFEQDPVDPTLLLRTENGVTLRRQLTTEIGDTGRLILTHLTGHESNLERLVIAENVNEGDRLIALLLEEFRHQGVVLSRLQYLAEVSVSYVPTPAELASIYGGLPILVVAPTSVLNAYDERISLTKRGQVMSGSLPLSDLRPEDYSVTDQGTWLQVGQQTPVLLKDLYSLTS